MAVQASEKTALELEADELLTSLRWELARLRLENLHVQGLEARRRVAAARGRIFTLLSGTPGADVTVVGRAVELALDGKPATAWDVDASLLQTLARWRNMLLPDLWARVSEYVSTTHASISEQIMLLTYLEAFLPDEAPGEVWDLDVVSALETVLETPSPQGIYDACGRLTLCGGNSSTTFATHVAELALTALAVALQPDGQ